MSLQYMQYLWHHNFVVTHMSHMHFNFVVTHMSHMYLNFVVTHMSLDICITTYMCHNNTYVCRQVRHNKVVIHMSSKMTGLFCKRAL